MLFCLSTKKTNLQKYQKNQLAESPAKLASQQIAALPLGFHAPAPSD
jgi:hypothetical protein